MSGIRVSIISVALLLFSIFPGVVSAEKGDCNRDGEITAVDALMALKMSIKSLPADLIADMDDDGRVTSLDAANILKAAVKKGRCEDVFDRLNGLIEENNDFSNVPFVKELFGNERINCYISLDGDVCEIGIITKDARVVEFKESRISDPTMNIYTSERAIRSIVGSKDPLAAFQKALSRREITYEGIGIIKKAKLFAVSVGLKVYNLFF
jgi:hypothetical protein